MSAVLFTPDTLGHGVGDSGLAYRSDYGKYLPGQFVRNRPKIEQNCLLLWDIFSSAKVNDLFMTFTSRLKIDIK